MFHSLRSSHASLRRTPKRAKRPHFQQLESRRLLAAGSDDLAPMSDEFDDAESISSWMRVHETEGWNADQLQLWDVNQTQPGRMVMQPHTVVWYENYRGPMAYKSITGDFVVTTQVSITDRDDVGDSDVDDVPDDAQYSLGGIMIRTPKTLTDGAAGWTPGGENYVFLSLGHGTDGGFSYEVKTTQSSNSNLALTPTTSGTATLQIARVGNSVILLRQEPGQDWVVHQRYTRPDMPETLQVGMVSYTDWDKASDFTPLFHNGNALVPGVAPDPTPAQPINPDLVTGYEYIRYARPEVPAELTGIDLAGEATDQQLLTFLGNVANQPTTTDADLASLSVRFLSADLDPIDQVTAGDSFFIEIAADDVRADGSGVFSAYVDATYASELAAVNGPVLFGDSFPYAQNAVTTSPGLLDEVGGIGDTPTDGSPQVLARIPMTAIAAGTLAVDLNAADDLPAHELGLYGIDQPIESEHIQFGSASLTIHAANLPPTANDDSANLFHNDAPIVVDVLANDAAEPGETLTITSIGAPLTDGGTFEIVEGGIRFTGNGQFTGAITTPYTIDDGNGGQATANLTVNVARQWHLQSNPTDTNQDGSTSPLDALRVINAISRHGSFATQPIPQGAFAEIDFFLDVNNDNMVSPIDALQVINALESASDAGSGEGEGIVAAAGEGLLAFLQDDDDGEADLLLPSLF